MLILWAAFALLLYLILTEATFGFFWLGVLWGLFVMFSVAIVLVPATAVGILMVALLNRIGWLPTWVNVKASKKLGLCLVLLSLLSGLYYSRPSIRFEHLIETDGPPVSEIKAKGFNSFLARRWLISFKASETQVRSIAANLELQEEGDIDLRKSLERDIFFSKLASELFERIPSTGFSHSYAQSDQDNETKHWIYLVYSDALQKAWLYLGYQN